MELKQQQNKKLISLLPLLIGGIAVAGLGYFGGRKPINTPEIIIKSNDPQYTTCTAVERQLFRFDTQPPLTYTPKAQLDDHLRDIITNMIQLYECEPVAKNYDIYDLSAEFEDPICHAQGVDEIKIQFHGMATVFNKCKIVRSHVYSLEEAPYPFPEQCSLDSPRGPPALAPKPTYTPSRKKKPKRSAVQVKMELWQLYRILGVDVPLKSIVILDLDPVSGKIIRHQDYWFYRDYWRLQGGVSGYIWNFARRAFGKHLPKIIKDPYLNDSKN